MIFVGCQINPIDVNFLLKKSLEKSDPKRTRGGKCPASCQLVLKCHWNKYLGCRNLQEQGRKENERSFYEPLAVFVSHVKHTFFFFFKKDLSTESIYAFCCAIICKRFYFRLEFQVTHSNLIRNRCYPNTYDTLHTT